MRLICGDRRPGNDPLAPGPAGWDEGGRAREEGKRRRPPTARSEGENVAMILPVFVPEAPAGIVDIWVALSIQHAEQLIAQRCCHGLPQVWPSTRNQLL
jgi:hypothetical protein